MVFRLDKRFFGSSDSVRGSKVQRGGYTRLQEFARIYEVLSQVKAFDPASVPIKVQTHLRVTFRDPGIVIAARNKRPVIQQIPE